MAEKKIIAVVGATGAQGGGLVRAILSDASNGFTPRALTRNVNSDKATELAKLGAEVVAADLDEIQSLKKRFEGAYGAFCVTNFWEHFSPEKELAQATNMARAAKEAALEHLIWSTFEDTRQWVPPSDNRMPTLMGKYKVPHFDAKGEANQVFTEMGVPATFLLTSFYWENFIHFGMGPKRGPDGILAITMPMGDKKLPSIAVEDIGKCAYGIFQRGHELIGKTIGVAGEHLTGTEMAAALTRALGEEVRYNNVSPDVYRNLGFPGADLGNMFQFKHDFNEVYCGNRDVDAARALNPTLQTFDEWLAQNRAASLWSSLGTSMIMTTRPKGGGKRVNLEIIKQSVQLWTNEPDKAKVRPVVKYPTNGAQVLAGAGPFLWRTRASNLGRREQGGQPDSTTVWRPLADS